MGGYGSTVQRATHAGGGNPATTKEGESDHGRLGEPPANKEEP